MVQLDKSNTNHIVLSVRVCVCAQRDIQKNFLLVNKLKSNSIYFYLMWIDLMKNEQNRTARVQCKWNIIEQIPVLFFVINVCVFV